jgi:ferredoxin, 2Fe-2S
MPKITYIEHTGATHVIDAKVGASVMETAVRNGISGIVAECGGSCSCATCHVYVDPAWLNATGERSDLEQSMLEFAAGVAQNSRLSCQIKVTDQLDGLVVRIPEVQGG